MVTTSKYTSFTTRSIATVCFCNSKCGYRFSFNGKELDKEGMGGGGSTYDYGFRIYNAQLGKFLSVDPLTASFPWLTSYQFAGNTPIFATDLEGLEIRNGYYTYHNDGTRKINNANDQEVADKIDLAILALKNDDEALYNYLNQYLIDIKAGEWPVKKDDFGQSTHQLGEINHYFQVQTLVLDAGQAYDRKFGVGEWKKLGENDYMKAKEWSDEYNKSDPIKEKVYTFGANILINISAIDKLALKFRSNDGGKIIDYGKVLKHEAGHFLFDMKNFNYEKDEFKYKSGSEESEIFAKMIEKSFDLDPNTDSKSELP